MAQIDSLEIKIVAEATSAIAALDTLSVKLTALSASLTGINTTGLTDLATGVAALTTSVQGIRAINGNTINSIVNNINNLNGINSANFSRLATNLRQLSDGLATVTAAAGDVTNITQLASAISRFGSASMQRAVANLPNLTNALVELFTRLSMVPAVSNDVMKLVRALGQLASAGQKVATTSNAIHNGLNTIGGSAKKNIKAFKSLASVIGKFYATYFIVIRAVKAAWQGAEKAMDYIETFNYFDVALGKIQRQFKDSYENFGYEDAETYAASFSQRLRSLTNKMTGFELGENGVLSLTDRLGLGMDAEQLLGYQARILGVTNSVGLLGETSVNTAKALSMLAGDLSSLTNTDLSDVMEKLQSGLIGQSRSLYAFGIDITNATLAEYAFANGITKAVSEMSQSEKMQLRLLAILDQSRVAWTDQASTINSTANQYRIFRQQISNLTRTIGNLLLPIVERALPVLNGIVIALNRVFTMLGFKIYGDSWLEDLTNASDRAISPIADLGDEFDSATESAKKFKHQLLGIDEINLLSTDQKNASGLEDNIDLWKEIKLAVEDYESEWNKALAGVQNKAEEFADKFTKPFMDAESSIENVIDSLERLKSQFGLFTDIFPEIEAPYKFTTLIDGFAEINDILTIVIGNFTALLTVAKMSWQIFRGDFTGAKESAEKLEEIFQNSKDAVIDITRMGDETIAWLVGGDISLNWFDMGGLEEAKREIDEFAKWSADIGSRIGGSFQTIADVIEKIGSGFEKVMSYFDSDGDGIYVINVTEELEKLRKKIVNLLYWLYSLQVAIPKIFAGKALENLQRFGDSIGTSILAKIEDIVPKMQNLGKDIIQGLIDGISGMTNSLRDTMGEITDKGLIRTIKEKLGIRSPSRVFYEIGGNMMEGMENGMEAMYGNVSHSLERFSGSLSTSPYTSLSAPSVRSMTYNPASTSDISAAVYDAVVSALRQMNTNVNVTLEGDARGIFNVVQNSAREYANRTGNPAFI